MSSKKNNFDLVFVGDSYTQGYGLWYYYWCKNKLLQGIDYQEKYHTVGAVHSGFVDNRALIYGWTNRFPALVASHFNTTYTTNCWVGEGHFAGFDNGFPLSRERPQVAGTKLIESYLKYFRKYGNEDKKYFILQVSEITRDTLLGYTHQRGKGIHKRIDDIMKEMEESIAKHRHKNKPNQRDIQLKNKEYMWIAVRQLMINSQEGIFSETLQKNAPHYNAYFREIPYPEKPSDLFKSNNFEMILYALWEEIWSTMQIELKKYNCELLILHTHQNTYENMSLSNTIKIGKDGYINHSLFNNETVEKEIYDKYNIVVDESHPGLLLHRKIANSIIQFIEESA